LTTLAMGAAVLIVLSTLLLATEIKAGRRAARAEILVEESISE
jgi:hypothetical protein